MEFLVQLFLDNWLWIIAILYLLIGGLIIFHNKSWRVVEAKGAFFYLTLFSLWIFWGLVVFALIIITFYLFYELISSNKATVQSQSKQV